MTAREVIEIIKESKLWVLLTEKEKQEVIRHALNSTGLSTADEEIHASVGEVYLELE